MEQVRFGLSALGVAVLAATFTVCAQHRDAQSGEPPASPQPRSVTVKELAADPSSLLDSTIRVSGTLENQGTNYFTDLRIVLRDEDKNTIPVRPWLPVSLPPRPPNAESSGKEPAVLSDLLGKKVELDAVVRKGDLRRFGDVHYLEVTSSRLR